MKLIFRFLTKNFSKWKYFYKILTENNYLRFQGEKIFIRFQKINENFKK